MDKKYVMSNDKSQRIACVKHNGEHPFYFKASVNAFVTYCHEVLTVAEYREIAKKELHDKDYERTHTSELTS